MNVNKSKIKDNKPWMQLNMLIKLQLINEALLKDWKNDLKKLQQQWLLFW